MPIACIRQTCDVASFSKIAKRPSLDLFVAPPLSDSKNGCPEILLSPTFANKRWFKASKEYWNDAPRTYYGLEDKHGEHGKDDQGLQGSVNKLKEEDGIVTHQEDAIKMPFDPLNIPLGPMTRARAKRFKDSLMGLVRTHLEDLKTIEVQLKSFGDDLGKKLQINYKFITLLAIDSRWPD
ncbi:hypothetical protein CCACVL1_17583 [Corchorus capsularis]|uniref:Uncharacterized protein n=1 Tax=Corchorus capsularis TaxID=210143 RepID=A0A1R3HR85_COCAP|nr:hypothetical protein CCACVL1_17583 [Corchorus capsularis]